MEIEILVEGEDKSLRWVAYWGGKRIAVSYLSAETAEHMAIQRIPVEELPTKYQRKNNQ